MPSSKDLMLIFFAHYLTLYFFFFLSEKKQFSFVCCLFIFAGYPKRKDPSDRCGFRDPRVKGCSYEDELFLR